MNNLLMKFNVSALLYILCIIVANNALSADDSLLLDLKFKNCQAVDESIYENTFTVVGSNSLVCGDGLNGKAFYFDNNYLKLNSNIEKFNFNKLSQPFTIVGIIKPDDGWSRYTADKIFPIFCTRKYGLWSSMALVQNDPDQSLYYDLDWEKMLHEWHHYVVVYSVSNSIGTFYMYIDGEYIGQKSQALNNNNYAYRTPTIGYSTHHDGIYSKGAVERVMVYNRALSAEEIYLLYTNGSVYNPIYKLLDLDSSGIDYENNKLYIKFKNNNFADMYMFEATSGSTTLRSVIYNSSSMPAYGFECDLDPELIDREISIKISNVDSTNNYEPVTVKVTYDQILARAPEAVVAFKNLKETKISLSNINNNSYNYFENQDYLTHISRADDNSRLQVGTATTHRILDFDKIVTRAINVQWQNTNYAKTIQKQPTNRIPILLIHGWQGDNSDFKDRQSSSLLLWEMSELQYWQHFLDYYLSSSKLQSSFHIYLYHYPSYKHITFNASNLKDLLSSASAQMSDLALGMQRKSLVVIGHSMGGLVARDLIEEYEFDKFNKLITLDTPHHGTPLSIDSPLTGTPKDLGTQGAADLNWDNVDNYHSDSDIDKNNINRWTYINTKEFDGHYWEKLQGIVGESSMVSHHTQNPWLRWLNIKFSVNYEKYMNKYILYVAALNNIDNGLSDAVDNAIFNFPNGYLASCGYTNGGAEPTGSSFLASFNDEIPFKYFFMPTNTFTYNSATCAWLSASKTVDTISDSSNKIEFIISKGLEHPFKLPYRLFIDYDHEKMVNGCYNGKKGNWDKYITESFVLDFDTQDDTAFNSSYYFKSYTGSMFHYLNGSSLADTSKLNPLRYEPVFNLLQKDLLSNKAKYVNTGLNVLLNSSN